MEASDILQGCRPVAIDDRPAEEGRMRRELRATQDASDLRQLWPAIHRSPQQHRDVLVLEMMSTTLGTLPGSVCQGRDDRVSLTYGAVSDCNRSDPC
jgi:hypothetical protein